MSLFDSDARARLVLRRAINPINGNRTHTIGRFAQLARRMRHRQATLDFRAQRNQGVTNIGKTAYRFTALQPTIVAARMSKQTRTHENIHRLPTFHGIKGT